MSEFLNFRIIRSLYTDAAEDRLVEAKADLAAYFGPIVQIYKCLRQNPEQFAEFTRRRPEKEKKKQHAP